MTGFDSEAQSKRISFFCGYLRACNRAQLRRTQSKQTGGPCCAALFFSLWSTRVVAADQLIHFLFFFLFFSSATGSSDRYCKSEEKKLLILYTAGAATLPSAAAAAVWIQSALNGETSEAAADAHWSLFFFLLFGRVYINHDQWWRVECPGAID